MEVGDDFVGVGVFVGVGDFTGVGDFVGVGVFVGETVGVGGSTVGVEVGIVEPEELLLVDPFVGFWKMTHAS